MNQLKHLLAYIAIPIKHSSDSYLIEQKLTQAGYIVMNPCSLITNDKDKNMDNLRSFVSKKCYEMIDEADFLVLYADYYGRDCAAEVGYAAHAGKPVFPFSMRPKSQYHTELDWMIYPKVQPVSSKFEDLLYKIAIFFK